MVEDYTLTEVQNTIDNWHQVSAKHCNVNSSYLDGFLRLTKNERETVVGKLYSISIHCGLANLRLKSKTDRLKKDMAVVLSLVSKGHSKQRATYDALIMYFLEYFKGDLLESNIKDLNDTAAFVIGTGPIQVMNTPVIFDVIKSLKQVPDLNINLVECNGKMVI